jgi:polyphosphate glucokinase
MPILGIDIGASAIKGALVDVERGELVTERERIPVPDRAQPEAIADIVLRLVDTFQYHGVVGCGFPAVIRNGVAYTASNVHPAWLGTDVAELFMETTGQPFHVINDADAAGIAEMRFGVGREFQEGTAIMLTLGTGIGSAVFTADHLVPNTEFGHLKIKGKDAELLASDGARRRRKLSWKAWGRILEKYLGTMESLFWPDVFILGGGGSKYFDKVSPHIHIRTPMVTAQFLNAAGIIGAAAGTSYTLETSSPE